MLIIPLTPGVVRAIFALGMAFQQSNATNLEETLEALTDEDWRELDVKPDEVKKAVELLIWAEVIKEKKEKIRDE